MKNLGLLALVVAPLVTGCGFESSSSGWSSGSGSSTTTTTSSDISEHSAAVDTSQMRASMSAQSDGTTTKIYASVFDSNTSEGLVLDQGDFFTASAGPGDPIVLVYEPSDDASVIHYSASLPASATAQDVVVSFVRQNGGVSAPSSIIHVPAPFEIVSTPPTSVAYGDDLQIRVSPVPTDDIEVEAMGTCLVDSSGEDNLNTYDDAIEFDANGNGTFSTEWLMMSGYSSSSGCNVSLYFSAIHDGTLDPAFGGGVSGYHDIEGTQKRGLVVTVTQ